MRLLLALPILLGPGGAPAPAELSSAAERAEPKLHGEVELTGPHFRVRGWDTTTAVVREALATAEAVFAPASELYGEPADRDLIVNLLPTAAEYQKIDRRLTGGNFADNLAFSSFRTRAAYVALQPEAAAETFAAIGLSNLTRHQVAHEAAHVVCYNALASHPYHPVWFSEGAAAWLAEEVMIARGWSPGLEEDPFTAKWILVVQELFERGRVPSLAVLLKGERDDFGPYERYALFGLVFRFLREETEPAEFDELWARARDLPAGPTYPRDLWAVVEHVWDVSRLRGDLNERFRRFVAALRPRWDQIGRSLEIRGATWTQIAFPREPARAWNLEPPRRPSFALTGALEIVAARPERGLELLVGRRDAGHLSVHVARDGRVSIARHRPDRTWPGPYEVLAEARLEEPLAAGRRLPFRLEVAPHRLGFEVAGVTLEATPSPVDRTHDWGVGARAGVTGAWHGLRVE